jgi:uncharacterized protein (DUF305 family)
MVAISKGLEMQINIDKKTGSLVAIIVVLLGIILGFSISRNSDEGFFGMRGNNSMGMRHNSGTATYTGADVMFLQMMIPHHQQAVDISDLAISRSKDTELIELAKKIRNGQAAEIIQMKNWLADAGDSSMMGHGMNHGMNHSMGDGMGGMLTESELSTLNSLSGSKFDAYWLRGMITHHEGALHMVTMIRDSNRPEFRSFGKEIVSVQTVEIEQMKKMLSRMGV